MSFLYFVAGFQTCYFHKRNPKNYFYNYGVLTFRDFWFKRLSWNARIMNSEDWLYCTILNWVQQISKVPFFANFHEISIFESQKSIIRWHACQVIYQKFEVSDNIPRLLNQKFINFIAVFHIPFMNHNKKKICSFSSLYTAK